MNGTLFDIGVSRPEFGPGMAVYTFQDRNTPARPCRAPTRAAASATACSPTSTSSRRRTSAVWPRARRISTTASPPTIPAIIDHYEAALGFDFTAQEEADLAAFLAAL